MVAIDITKDLHGSNGNLTLNVNLSIEDGSFVSVTGKSGSGKTTFLRIMAGLENAKGSISYNDEIWLDQKIDLAVQKRGIGFVFQEYALFDNMSVEENLLFVKNDKQLAQKLLEMTELTELRNRKPASLSGGQKQRVSLCRAMMNKPKLLLMDEPFSALDIAMRKKLQDEILTLHKEFHTTTIMVSHEPSEIYKLSDRVIVFDNGRVIQDGRPKDVLLKADGSQKFSFEGEILEINKIDVIYVAVISIAQQIVEVVVSAHEAQNLHVGQRVSVGTKAFAPIIR